MDDLITSAGEDNILDFGETGSFHVELENVGQEASGELLINLSHDGTMINILADDLTHTSVDPGELATVGPFDIEVSWNIDCLLYTSPSPRDRQKSRMPSSA